MNLTQIDVNFTQTGVNTWPSDAGSLPEPKHAAVVEYQKCF
jgi:hypothetical protein